MANVAPPLDRTMAITHAYCNQILVVVMRVMAKYTPCQYVIFFVTIELFIMQWYSFLLQYRLTFYNEKYKVVTMEDIHGNTIFYHATT
jgi:hypothetical protein